MQQDPAFHLLVKTNPVPYFALQFGLKACLDQDLDIGQEYGCTHVLIIGGCSRLIVGYTSVPTKNPVLVCECIFCLVGMDHERKFNKYYYTIV